MNALIAQHDTNQALLAALDIFYDQLNQLESEALVIPVLFLKYASDMAKYNPALFEIPAQASFDELYLMRHEAGNDKRLNHALKAIVAANQDSLSEGQLVIFKHSHFKPEGPHDAAQINLCFGLLLEHFSLPALTFSPAHPHRASLALQHLLTQIAVNNRYKKRREHTPPAIADLLVDLLAPVAGERLCDPACGAGSVLMSFIARSGSDNHICGQAEDYESWSRAKLTAVLSGHSHQHIAFGNLISRPLLLDEQGQLLRFDVIASCPQLAQHFWQHGTANNDPYLRFERGIPPETRGHYAYILHMVETMASDTGRMAVVMPHGVLFRGSSEAKIRQALIEDNLLEAVIGLPNKLLYDTAIETTILVFNRNKTDNQVLFIDASHDFHKTKALHLLTKAQIERIGSTHRLRQSVERYARLVSFDEVESKDFNLNISLYVDVADTEEEKDIGQLMQEQAALKAELAALDIQMASYRQELGY